MRFARLHGDELRVSAGDEQREERIGRLLVAIEERREDVTVQMVDRVQGSCRWRTPTLLPWRRRRRGCRSTPVPAVTTMPSIPGNVVPARSSASSIAAERSATCAAARDLRYDAAVLGVKRS